MILLRIPEVLLKLAGHDLVKQDVLQAAGKVQQQFLAPGWQLEVAVEAEFVSAVPVCIIHHKEADYTAALASSIFYYCRREHLRQIYSVPVLMDELAKSKPEDIRQFLTVFTEQVLTCNRYLMIDEDSAAATWNEATCQNSVPDGLTDVLRLLLKQGIGLTDQVSLYKAFNNSISYSWTMEMLAENLVDQLSAPAIELRMPDAWFETLSKHVSDADKGVFKLMKEGLFYELGILYPEIKFIMDDSLPDEYFQVRLNNLFFLPVKGLRPGEYLVSKEAAGANSSNTPVINPANGSQHYISSDLPIPGDVNKWSHWEFIVLAASKQLRDFAFVFITRSAVTSWLDKLALAFPDLVKSVKAKRPVEFITAVLRLLAAEGISIRHLPQLLQSILEFDFVLTDGQKYIVFDVRLTTTEEPSVHWLNDPVNTCSFVRTNLKHYISYKYTHGQTTLPVYLLDPAIEDMLLAGELTEADALNIKQAISAQMTDVQVSNAILTTHEVRPRLRRLIELAFPHTPVLAYQELAAFLNIQPLARITLN